MCMADSLREKVELILLRFANRRGTILGMIILFFAILWYLYSTFDDTEYEPSRRQLIFAVSLGFTIWAVKKLDLYLGSLRKQAIVEHREAMTGQRKKAGETATQSQIRRYKARLKVMLFSSKGAIVYLVIFCELWILFPEILDNIAEGMGIDFFPLFLLMLAVFPILGRWEYRKYTSDNPI